MVWKSLIGLLAAVLIAVCACLYFHGREERRLRRRVHQLLELAEKKNIQEGAGGLALRNMQLSGILADSVQVNYRDFPWNGRYSGREFANLVLRGRSLCDEIHLTVTAMETELQDEEAVCRCAVRISVCRHGEWVKDDRMAQMKLRRVDGKWVFYRLEEDTLLRR